MLKTLLLAIVVVLAAPLAAGEAGRSSHVVLISVDGLPADYLDDPRVALPTLRKMAKEGARAERMLSVFPTVTWPNHTSMVTGVMPGRHGVVGNRFFDRAAGKDVELLWDPVLDKDAIVLRPTVYDVAHRAGLKTAGVAWPASRNARHLDWQVPCVIEPALLTRYTTPSLLAEITQLGIPIDRKPDWAKAEVGGKLLWDWMHTRIAQHILRTHQPNLLLVHFDGVDSLEHRNGRNSPESYWAANIVDHHISELVETVQTAGLAERTTFLVVSDHGFRNYTKQINLNATLRDMGLIKTAGNRIVESSVHLLAMSGGAGIYILDETKRAVLTGDLLARLPAIEGVEAVLGGEAIVAQGLPAPGPHSRAPDIMLSAAEGYTFSGRIPSLDVITPSEGIKGAHGHLPSGAKMHGSFIAFGAAIKPGTTLPEVRVVDIAPTIAAVLGVELPDVEGRTLSELLR